MSFLLSKWLDVLFSVQFTNFDQTTGFYWSYTLLPKPSVPTRPWPHTQQQPPRGVVTSGKAHTMTHKLIHQWHISHDTVFSTVILVPSPRSLPRFHLTADKLWAEGSLETQGQHKPQRKLAFSSPGLPHQKPVKANLSDYAGQINNLVHIMSGHLYGGSWTIWGHLPCKLQLLKSFCLSFKQPWALTHDNTLYAHTDIHTYKVQLRQHHSWHSLQTPGSRGRGPPSGHGR